MAQAALRWGPYPLADPIWWAEQQLRVVTATTTYLTRVTQAVADAAAPHAIEAGPAPAVADEPIVPAVVDEVPAPAVVDEVPVPAVPETPPVPTVTEPADVTPSEELPVARWDELSLGSIRARLSRLSEADLVTLHGYEERHGGRPDVLSMLANRLIKMREADGPAGSAG